MKLIWPFDSTMVEKWMVNAFRCYTEIVKENKNHKFKNIPHINSARIVEPPENSWSLAPIVNSKKNRKRFDSNRISPRDREKF